MRAEIHRNPASAEARCLLAMIALTRRPADAGPLLRQACVLAPSYPPVHYYLTLYRPERGDIPGMLASMARAKLLLDRQSKMAALLGEFTAPWRWLDDGDGLAERWTAPATPKPGPASWFFVWRDLGEFLLHFDLAEVGPRHTFQLPLSASSSEIDLREELFRACRQIDSDIVVFLPGTSRHRNPPLSTFRALRARGVPTVLVVPDLRKVYWQGVVKRVAETFDLVVSLDGCSLDSLPSLRELGERFFRGWSPISPAPVPAYLGRPIAANLVGSLWGDRIAGVGALRQAGIDVMTRPSSPPGAQDADVAAHKTLTTEAYLATLRQSRLTINFSACSTGDGAQLKGRVFEAAACGSLLLESVNDVTRDYFEEGRDFIYFDGIPDLVEKARYYLDHPDKAAVIAANATRRFLDRYTAAHFWRDLLDRARTNHRATCR